MNDTFLDPMTQKVIEESAKTLFETAWSIVKDIGKKISNEGNVFLALRRYSEHYLRRNGSLKVLGMAEPLPLKDIYTSVKIIYPHYRNRESEIENLEQQFRNNRSHSYLETRRSGFEIVNQKPRLNILGAPGSGKSTFLKRIGMEALALGNSNQSSDCKFEHTCIPVLIELKRLRNESKDIKQLISQEFELAGLPEPEQFTEKALEKGKLLILLDGLDEVSASILVQTINDVRDVTDKYSRNRFVTSCRTAYYKSYFTEFTDVEIAHFDNDQIKVFISNWFRYEEDIRSNSSNRLIEILFSDKNISTLELARTPLLLTFICLTFDDSQKFPANRSSLYKRALLILMEKWAAEKRIHNEDIYQDLNSDLELEMLSDLAANFFKNDKIFFYHSEIKSELNTFLENSLNVKNIPLSKIIEAIEVQQGLLVQRAPDIYSFSHLTIQEYLTAYNFLSTRKINSLIECHLFEVRWREVFLLLAGMTNSDELVANITEFLRRYSTQHAIIQKSISWISGIIDDSSDVEKDACKRLIAVSILLRFKRYDSLGYSNAQRLEQSADELIRKLSNEINYNFLIKKNISKKTAIEILDVVNSWKNKSRDYSSFKEEITLLPHDQPLSTMLHGSRNKFYKAILKSLYKAIDIPDDLVFINRNLYQPLLNYIEAYSLLVDCKNSSLRISREIWIKACKNLLKIDPIGLSN